VQGNKPTAVKSTGIYGRCRRRHTHHQTSPYWTRVRIAPRITAHEHWKPWAYPVVSQTKSPLTTATNTRKRHSASRMERLAPTGRHSQTSGKILKMSTIMFKNNNSHTVRPIYLPTSHSVSLFLCPSLCLCVCLSVCLSVRPSVRLSNHILSLWPYHHHTVDVIVSWPWRHMLCHCNQTITSNVTVSRPSSLRVCHCDQAITS